MTVAALEAQPRLEEFQRRYKAEFQAFEAKHANGSLPTADMHSMTAVLNLLFEIDCAIKAINEGTYGQCAACGDPIEPDRLKFFPWATHHTKCKSQQPSLTVGDVIAGKRWPIEKAEEPQPEQPEQPERVFRDEPGVAINADEMTELTCGHWAVGVWKEGDEWPYCAECRNHIAPVNAPDTATGFVDRVIPNVHNQGGSMEVLISEIHPSPLNPRKELSGIEELAASIDSIGLIQNIVVRPNEDGFELIAGARRLEALKLLKWEKVTVDVQALGDKEAEEARLIENLHREDLTALEEARGYQRLIAEHGMSQHEIAQRLGRSQSHISKRVGLLELPETALTKIASRELTPSEGLELLRLKGDPKRIEKVVKSFDEGKDFGYTVNSLVETEIKAKSDDDKRKVEEKKLRDANVRVMSSQKLHAIDYKNRARIGTRVGDLNIDRKAHTKEPCHAAVFEYGVKPTHYCTDVARHRPKGESELKGGVVTHQTLSAKEKASPEAIAKREFIATMGEAQERRREFVTDLVKRTIPRDDAIGLFCLTLLNVDWFEISPGETAKLLSLVGDGERVQKDVELRDYADKSAENRVRVLLAAVIDVLEHELDPDVFDGPNDKVEQLRPYFEFLQRHGYEPNEHELRIVGADVAVAEDDPETGAEEREEAPVG